MKDRRPDELVVRSRPQWDVPTDHEMPFGERLLWKVGILGPIFALPLIFFAVSPFPPKDTVVHYAAAVSCPMGELLGVVPAEEGEPGYHKRLDTDQDGVACEPETPRSFKGGGGAQFRNAPEAPSANGA